MSTRRSKRQHSTKEEDEDEGPISPRRRVSSQADDDDNDDEVAAANGDFMFSQQAPEASQSVLPERAAERRNLDSMSKEAREKAITSLSRLLLFKALEREPLDRIKLAKDAGIASDRISSAAFQEAATRLKNVFGFSLVRIPKYMEKIKGLPKKFKDRFFVINDVGENADGTHSKHIHSVHDKSAIERGLLILMLSLTFCKGESRADGSRWILGRDLYRLLHSVDDSLPEEPPAQGTARAKAGAHQKFQNDNVTPNVDAMLEHFCHCDYLIKDKATEDNFASQTLEEGDVLYTMGPRAALEVGRKQVIFFCAEILDEEPDPSMLKEVENDMEEEGEEFEEGVEEVVDEVYMEATQ